MNPACPACTGETALTGWEDAYGFECQGCRGHVIRSTSLIAFLTKHEEAIPYHPCTEPPPRRLPRTFEDRRRMNEEIIELMARLFF